LILDEATSALDYESEAIIARNMRTICQGRTVITIAHRLSAVRNAHRVIVMDKGRIIEAGPHDALIQMPKGLYAHLWKLQQAQQTDTGEDTDKPGKAHAEASA
jgi:ATP-binding cassette, subfamily B, bacterial HlyB/CyaB